MTVKKRIGWIDTAKGIVILLMIIGHMVAYGTSIRNFIFSFHMPVFFILTGYTIGTCSSWKEFGRKEVKDFRYIYVPVLITLAVEWLIGVIAYREPMSGIYTEYIPRLFWALAAETQGHPPLRELWFLVALFYGKMLYRCIQMIFPEKGRPVVFAACYLMIRVLRGIILPQALDLVFLVAVYLYLGALLRKYEKYLDRYCLLWIPAALFVWVMYLLKGYYVELGTRQMIPMNSSILESIAGSFCILYVSKAIEKYAGGLERVFSKIGTETLLILCIHCIDYRILGALPFLRNCENFVIRVVIRIVFDVGGAFALKVIFGYIRKKKEQYNLKKTA